eukprot:jgi/Chlat1/5418/Chrsp35S05322
MSSAAAAVAVAQACANGHGRWRQSGARPLPASVRVAPPASPVASRAVSMGGAATFTTRDSTELLLAAARASASTASASSSSSSTSPTTKDVKEAQPNSSEKTHASMLGHVYHRVEHCLLALPGVEMKDIRRVMSHPQGCFLHVFERDCILCLCDCMDGSLVVKLCSLTMQFIAREGLRDAAAVASERAAKLYGLNILDSGIQDDEGNVTRFLALAREPVSLRPDVLCKTSIVFSLEEGPGTLFKALSTFALRDINLTKSPIAYSAPARHQCRPTRRFDYLFYIDFAASMSEQRAQNALRHLQEFAPFLRVLGSYPMAMFNG